MMSSGRILGGLRWTITDSDNELDSRMEATVFIFDSLLDSMCGKLSCFDV